VTPIGARYIRQLEQNLAADAGELDGPASTALLDNVGKQPNDYLHGPFGVKQNGRCIASREEVLGDCSRAERGPGKPHD